MSHSTLFEFELQNFKMYVEDIFNYIHDISEGIKGEYGERSDEYEVYKYEFTSLFGSSTFISIMSFVEINLEKVCLWMKSMGEHTIEITDLKDKGIRRSITYMSKVLGKGNEIKRIKSKIDKFYTYSDIRNRIVHNEGLTPWKDLSRFQELIPSLEYVEIFIEKKIRINQPFLEQLLSDIKDLFEEIDTIFDLSKPFEF